MFGGLCSVLPMSVCVRVHACACISPQLPANFLQCQYACVCLRVCFFFSLPPTTCQHCAVMGVCLCLAAMCVCYVSIFFPPGHLPECVWRQNKRCISWSLTSCLLQCGCFNIEKRQLSQIDSDTTSILCIHYLGLELYFTHKGCFLWTSL